MNNGPAPDSRFSAFSLVEILVATAVLALLLLVLISTTDATRRLWSETTGKVEQFKEAREAFESMTRRLSQATLNTYWDYDNPTTPTRYIRQSELRFISGNAGTLLGTSDKNPTHAVFFQAPIGFSTDVKYNAMSNLLNTWGYFVEFGADQDLRPPFLDQVQSFKPQYRYRLHEMMQPAEEMSIYDYTSGEDASGKRKNDSYVGHEWFLDPLSKTGAQKPVRVLAENIVGLVILPKLSPQEDATTSKLAPNYSYDSTSSSTNPETNPKNQLPPILQVTLIAVEEAAFSRLQTGTSQPNLGLDSLFQDAAAYEDNLTTLETKLVSHKLPYRTFTTNVPIRAAKWSRSQSN